MIIRNFSELNLNNKVFKAIEGLGFEKPSDIQAEAIPVIMEGKDLIAQSQTGTGKTLAFAAPVISMMLNNESLENSNNVKVLILTPTRELAMQVTEEVNRIGKYANLRVLPVFGGQSIDRQFRELRRGVDIVVGTPGRIIDHIERGTLKLEHIEFLVIDEADEMLNMGFIEEVESIIKNTNSDKQTLLFSATISREIKGLAHKYMKKDIHSISVVKEALTVDKIEQYYFQCSNDKKLDVLCRILDFEEREGIIIFCRTKKRVDELVEALQERGYVAEGMHGDMNQNQRINSLKRFKNSSLEILVATDVAARGIDVQNISHVINYDIPLDLESYVHRIGRTGRADREGIAYSIINSKEFSKLKEIERYTKRKIAKKDIPTLEDIMTKKSESLVDKVKESIENNEHEKFISIIEKLEKDMDVKEIAAAFMSMILDKEINLDEENELAEEVSFDRIFITQGRKDSLNPKLLLNFIDTNAGVTSSEIGTIDILESFSFMNVTPNSAQKIIKNANNKKLNGKKIRFEFANKGRN